MKALLRRLLGSGRNAEKGVSEKGLLLYPSTAEVIRAEALLRQAGVSVAVKGPPPDLRQGCDMVIEFDLLREMHVRAILEEARLPPLRVAAVQDHLLEPVSLYQIVDLGDYLMVRAANMKITLDRRDRRIVNVSGGGCPDVPYLAEALIGRLLHEAPPPRTLGKTLCGYSLQLAFAELQEQCPG
jgi:hypothetical protein